MTPFLATIRKELLEIRRDRAGLALMLLMPAALVLIVALVQDNVMRATGEAPIRVLFVDNDNSFLGRAIEESLSGGGLELVRKADGREFTAETARRAVVEGEYQFLVLIAPGTGEALRKYARQRAEESFVPSEERAKPAAGPSVPGLSVRFDPAVQGAFRTAVLNSLRRVILGIEMREKADALSRSFSRKIPVPGIRLDLDAGPVLDLAEEEETGGRFRVRPTAAQQNVPAWALFGMFFIVVPVSGALIRERQTGTFRRLMTMPVSPVALLAGKVAAYLAVCIAQFALMLGIGMYVLPLAGTSGLVVGPAGPAVAAIALVAALAASGYGIMIGTLARSYEQASMVGAVSVVIAAALGGIMIPVYVMPRFMQELSVVSPLAWGLNAFQDVFVREGTLRAAAPELACLSSFFVLTIMIAWLAMRKGRSGE
ncbi:MAG: transporter rane protein [Deltaproteobacteria bacterium]|nr:transporter rane protein [Deltaproteobacteria bacterium]